MGNILKKKIETVDGEIILHSNQGYWFHKSIGNLQIALNHYKDREAADAALPPFVEDTMNNDASGQIPFSCSMDNGTTQLNLSQLFTFHLTSSEKVPVKEWETWEEVREEEVQLIDYNDDGEEIESFGYQNKTTFFLFLTASIKQELMQEN